MSALELISFVNQVLFIGLFLVAARNAVRRPSRATLDTGLLFGSIAAAVLVARWADIGGPAAESLTPIILLLLSLAPYAMIRLVDDFSGTPRLTLAVGGLAYVGVAAAGFAYSVRPTLVEIIIIAWFVGVGGYAIVAFARESRRTRGITRRRMRAVAAGAVLFIGAVVTLLANELSGGAVALDIVGQLALLLAVVSFFIGFTPPASMRRAWREPDLRDFLEESVRLVSVSEEMSAIGQLEQAAAAAAGADGASIGVADHERSVLRYLAASGDWIEYPDDAFIAGQAYQEQRRIVAPDATALDPDHSDEYAESRARTVIAAPITQEDSRLGALAVYGDRAPIFVEDDLWLIDILAAHVAVVLEARALTRQTGRLEAREEAARLKEEFLSAAAHDLRTPLTVVLGQAELLERRLARDPAAPVDAAGVSRLANEARRLRDLVTEMLDAQRLEQGNVAMNRELADLRVVLDGTREHQPDLGDGVIISLHADPIPTRINRMRMQQTLTNLVENALKYSPDAAPPEVRLEVEDGEARLSVIDHGVGVPEGERERIFDRFYRASNANGITDTGMGLGLYICRRIVEEHDGRIWVEPTPGGGSTFIIALPIEGASDETNSTNERGWVSSPGTQATADA